MTLQTASHTPASEAPRAFFRTIRRVHWNETDAAGVVWYGHYLRYLEEVEDDLFRAAGRTKSDLAKELGIVLARTEAACRFRTPARADDVLELAIAIDDIGQRRLSYVFEARNAATRTVLVEATCRVAYVSEATFRSVDLPEPLKAVFERMREVARAQRDAERP